MSTQGGPTMPLPEPCIREALGEEVGGTCSPRNTALGPKLGVEYKLNPVWKRRTLTPPLPPDSTGLPKIPSYGSSSEPQASGVSQYTPRVVQEGMGWGGGICAPPCQVGPLWCMPA